MSETTTGPAAKSREAGKAEEKRRHHEPALDGSSASAGNSLLLDTLLGSSGSDPRLDRHAAILSDPRFSHSANAQQKVQMVSSLQSRYGNAYVQRLFASTIVQAGLDVNPADHRYQMKPAWSSGALVRTANTDVQCQEADGETDNLQVCPRLHTGRKDQEESCAGAGASGPSGSSHVPVDLANVPPGSDALSPGLPLGSFEQQLGRHSTGVKFDGEPAVNDHLAPISDSVQIDTSFSSGQNPLHREEGSTPSAYQSAPALQQTPASQDTQGLFVHTSKGAANGGMRIKKECGAGNLTAGHATKSALQRQTEPANQPETAEMRLRRQAATIVKELARFVVDVDARGNAGIVITVQHTGNELVPGFTVRKEPHYKRPSGMTHVTEGMVAHDLKPLLDMFLISGPGKWRIMFGRERGGQMRCQSTELVPGSRPKPTSTPSPSSQLPTTVVIVGSPTPAQASAGFPLQFVSAAMCQGKDANTQWIVEKSGYELAGVPLQTIEASAPAGGLVWLQPGQSAVDALNSLKGEGIARLFVFSHGVPGSVWLRYGWEETGAPNYGLAIRDVARLDPAKFTKDAFIEFNSCNTGVGTKEGNLAQEVASKTGHRVRAWTGRTSYKAINRGECAVGPSTIGGSGVREYLKEFWSQKVKGRKPVLKQFEPEPSRVQRTAAEDTPIRPFLPAAQEVLRPQDQLANTGTQTSARHDNGVDLCGVDSCIDAGTNGLSSQLGAKKLSAGQDMPFNQRVPEPGSPTGNEPSNREASLPVQQTNALSRQPKTATPTAKATSPVQKKTCPQDHLDDDPPYCCEEGKKLRSPAVAKQDYEKKTQGAVLSKQYVSEKDEDAEGPQNVVNCLLAAEVVGDLRKLLKAASTDGVEVKSSVGGRDLKGQWSVWGKNGHPKSTASVAKPGTSNHGTGRAIDFENKKGSFAWLLENAGAYGWVNLPTEAWHYDHVNTPGIIEQHRKTAKAKGTKRRPTYGAGAKPLTPEQRTALQSQYDAATVYVAVPWNQKRAYPSETWLKVQEYLGMPKNERTGVADEATVKAAMAMQKKLGFEVDGLVDSRMLKALGLEAGWSGTVKGSINVEATRQGKTIRRIPLERLSSVKATVAEDPKLARKKEFVQGRAIALVPDSVKGTFGEKVEVLVHLHGHTAGYKTATKKTKYGAEVGKTEDIDTDRIVQQLEASGRKMIAALPQGTENAEFSPDAEGFDCNSFMNEVLERLKRVFNWASAPTPSRTVLSGFSGGGDTIAGHKKTSGKTRAEPMLSPEGQGRLPAGMDELILFDALHSKEEVSQVWQFLEGKLNGDLAAIEKIMTAGGDSKQYIREKGFRFRGVTTGYSEDDLKNVKAHKKMPGDTYGPRYRELQRRLSTWFSKNAQGIGQKDSETYKALKENYQVKFLSTGVKEHGRIMGAAEPGESKGVLEEALSAGPASASVAPVVQRLMPTAEPGNRTSVIQRQEGDTPKEKGEKPANPAYATVDLKVKMAATILAESWPGQEEAIGWIYYNRVTAAQGDDGLLASSAFRNRSVWYRIWVHLLDDRQYGRDALGGGQFAGYPTIADFCEKNGYMTSVASPRAGRVKELVEGMFRGPKTNPYQGWKGQGSFEDFNRAAGKWVQARQYYLLQKEDSSLEALVKVLPASRLKNVSFTFDETRIANYFRRNPGKLQDSVPQLLAEDLPEDVQAKIEKPKPKAAPKAKRKRK